jgi:hypothetical protein
MAASGIAMLTSLLIVSVLFAAETPAVSEELQVPHAYTDGPQREHTWQSGWLDAAVTALLADGR